MMEELTESRSSPPNPPRPTIPVLVAADESVRKESDPLRVAREDAADLIVVKVAPLGGVRREGGSWLASYAVSVIPYQTPRLRFREMTPADLDNMAALLGDPAVMTYYPAPKTREQARGWIAWNEANYAEHGHGLWIVETSAGEFLGDCGLTWQDVNGRSELEIGYHVRPEAQGRGYASEAAAACRDFARDRLQIRQLVAIIHPDNVASRRVAEKIGMQEIEEDLRADGLRKILGMILAG